MFQTLVASSVFWEFPFGEALVLARPDLQGLFLLNYTSRLIWSATNQGIPVHSLAQQFSVDFNIPVSQAAHDIQTTLDSWSTGLFSRFSSPITPDVSPFAPDSNFQLYSLGNYLLGDKRLRLEVADREFAEEIAPRLAHLRSEDTQTPDVTFQVARLNGCLKLFNSGVFFAEELEVNAARAVLLQELAHVAQPDADWLTILHAGACGTGTACVVMPADTNAGKTTLTAALMHSGLQFFSDDSAAVDRHTMRVAPMPFALMIREGSWPVLASRFPELASAPVLERNGCNVRFLTPPSSQPGSGVPAKCLLFIEFKPGAATTLEPLTPFESLLRLQKSGFWVAHDRDSIGMFLSWLQSIPAYQAIYSDLDEATALVHRLLAGSLPVAE
ncbi:MAG TPA: PqqD family protein [Bryobacteraceae bacterium]